MTDAPDPGLTDLIAAHREGDYGRFGRQTCECGWTGDSHPAHVALVVEQHNNRRIAELEAELEKQKRGGRTLGKAIDRTLKWVIEASNSEDLIGDDGDGDWEIVWDRLFQLRPNLDAANARAEKAEATIASVHEIRCGNCGNPLSEGSGNCVSDAGRPHIYDEADLRAALEGEQQ